MKEILVRKPAETIHVSQDLNSLIIIASSCAENENKWHPHGMVVKQPDGKYNVIRYDGVYQFRKEGYESIRELIEKQVPNHWKFYAL